MLSSKCQYDSYHQIIRPGRTIDFYPSSNLETVAQSMNIMISNQTPIKDENKKEETLVDHLTMNYRESKIALRILDTRRVECLGYRIAVEKKPQHSLPFRRDQSTSDQFDWYMFQIWNCPETHYGTIIFSPQNLKTTHRIDLGHCFDDKIIKEFLIDFQSHHPVASSRECEDFLECTRDCAQIWIRYIEFVQG